MSKYLKAALVALLLLVIFAGGVVVGSIYNFTDYLCPVKAEPYILEQDFESESGIVIPKGTVIPLRQCAYMQRFNYKFAIDNATDLKQYKGKLDRSYGYSELYPKNE